MTTFFGLAVAFYGSSKTSITSTVLEGKTKEDIRIQSTATTQFKFLSTQPIQQEFGKLEQSIRDILANADESVTIPIVTGTEEEYRTADLFKILASIYRDVPVTGLGDGINKNVPIPIWKLEYVTRGEDHIVQRDYFNRSVAAILERAVDSDQRKRLHVEGPRTYASIKAQKRIKVPNAITMGMDLYDFIPDEFKDNLDYLLTKWEEGDETVHSDLLNIARELGTLGSEMYQLSRIRPMRYMSAPDDLRGRLYIVPGAREAYAEPITSALGLKFNVSVKGNLDTRSPPFADVAATIMGDYMDKVTGDKPGVVMVNHS